MNAQTPSELIDQAFKARPKQCVLIYVTERDELKVAISNMDMGALCHMAKILEVVIDKKLSAGMQDMAVATKKPTLSPVP